MKWTLLIAFGVVVIGCSHSPLQSSNIREPANGQNGPLANLFVYDSVVFNPSITLQRTACATSSSAAPPIPMPITQQCAS